MRRTVRHLIVLLGALAALPAMAQATAFKPCPFTAAELQGAFGVKFDDGKADPPLNASSVTMHTCKYHSKNYSVFVQSQVYQNAADAKKAATFGAGKMVAIPNDPDGAAYQEGQGDLTSPAVGYSRGSVATHLRIMGGYYQSAKTKEQDMKAMREKLAKLRRVP
jgi:hypothetical protein